nr:4502_t:CDS:2 [Entrophospora candida]
MNNLNNTSSDINLVDEEFKDLRLKGAICIVLFSTISSISSFSMFFWIVYQKSPMNNVITKLVMNLLVADYIQSSGFNLSYYWIIMGRIVPNILCDAQGFLINVGLWALAICVHTYMLVAHSYECPHLVAISMLIIWPSNLALSSLGFIFQMGTQSKFYNFAEGSWCWISRDYEVYRIAFHYGIILFIALAMIVFYLLMFAILYRRQRLMSMQNSKKVIQNVNKKLVWYPIVYLVLVFPLGLLRIISIARKDEPIPIIPAACSFTSAGFVNALIYCITRNLVSLRGVLGIVPKIRKRVTIISLSTVTSATTSFSTSIKDENQEDGDHNIDVISKIEDVELKSNSPPSKGKIDSENSNSNMDPSDDHNIDIISKIEDVELKSNSPPSKGKIDSENSNIDIDPNHKSDDHNIGVISKVEDVELKSNSPPSKGKIDSENSNSNMDPNHILDDHNIGVISKIEDVDLKSNSPPSKGKIDSENSNSNMDPNHRSDDHNIDVISKIEDIELKSNSPPSKGKIDSENSNIDPKNSRSDGDCSDRSNSPNSFINIVK